LTTPRREGREEERKIDGEEEDFSKLQELLRFPHTPDE
jgi:hypothetical protein